MFAKPMLSNDIWAEGASDGGGKSLNRPEIPWIFSIYNFLSHIANYYNIIIFNIKCFLIDIFDDEI